MQSRGLPLYVTDSHSLIWYLLDSPKLSLNANEVFKTVEEGKSKLLIPAIEERGQPLTQDTTHNSTLGTLLTKLTYSMLLEQAYKKGKRRK